MRSFPKRCSQSTDQDKSTVRNQNESPLLRLPAELRITIYRLAIDSVTISLTFKPTKLSRQGLTLPQVCRQFNNETKRLVDIYDTVRLSTVEPEPWLYGNFSGLAVNHRAIFRTTVTLRLSAQVADWIQWQADVFWWEDGVPRLSNPMPDVFKCLKCLILPSELMGCGYAGLWQKFFGRPYLELVFT